VGFGVVKEGKRARALFYALSLSHQKNKSVFLV
jgi:hypothetical protein